MSSDSNDTVTVNDTLERLEVEAPVIKTSKNIDNGTEIIDTENQNNQYNTTSSSNNVNNTNTNTSTHNENENELFARSLSPRPHFESDLEDAEYLSQDGGENSNSFSNDTFTTDGEGNEDTDYYPGDMIDLRGLFDENAVIQRRLSTALDFEEIPDDIDIDEPVEFEELSRAGKILNFVVKISFLFFAFLIIAFIFNVGLFIAAVIIHNKSPAKVFVDITDLDRTEATINIRVKTEASDLGGWVKGFLDNKTALNAAVYLSNSETSTVNDAMFEIKYLNPEAKVEYDGKLAQTIQLKGVKMRLNPYFDASRLSGFMEPKINNLPHQRYPLRVIFKFSMGFFVYFFGVPIPYPINMTTVLKFDENSEEAKAAAAQAARNMAQFDFNPKFVKFAPIDEEGKIKLHIRQPIPKFFAPKPFELSVQIPQLNWNVKQFTMLDPSDAPEIQYQIDNSHDLAQAVSKPFKFNVVDTLAPNIIDFEATIDESSLQGLQNVLQSIRDNKLKTLAFLVLSSKFKHPPPTPLKTLETGESIFPLLFPAFENPAVDSHIGCTFSTFMSSFWGRQAFPVGDGSQPLPSVPELYDPANDSAIRVKFQGIVNPVGSEPSRRALSFLINANTHYIITKYKLPMLMLSGVLPVVKFKVKVNKASSTDVASITVVHMNSKDPKENDQSLGKEVQLQILVDLDNLELLSQTALKLARFQELNAIVEEKERLIAARTKEMESNTRSAVEKDLDGAFIKKLVKELDLINGSEDSVSSIIGTMFKDINEMEIVADYEHEGKDSWVSQVASIFNMKFKLSGKKMEFVYSGSDLPVIQHQIKETPRIFTHEAYVALHKSLNALLFTKDDVIPADIESMEYKTTLSKAIESLKKEVNNSDQFFLKYSASSELDEEDIAKKLKPFKTLSDVRALLLEKSALNRAYYHSYPQLNHSAVLSVDSNEKSAQALIKLALHQFEDSLDDDLVFEWDRFEVGIADRGNTDLLQLVLNKGKVNMTLTSNQFFKSSHDVNKYIDLEVNFGPRDSITTEHYMNYFSQFYRSTESDRISFYNFILKINSNPLNESNAELKASWPGTLPTSLVKSLSDNVSKALSPMRTDLEKTSALSRKEPGFLDNLAKSHFDFIGYGFYRLIFNAMLPNPTECPNLSPISDSSSIVTSTQPFSDVDGNYKSSGSVFNVELNLPPTSAFIFANTASGKLHQPTCVAAINTSERLRLWTQIVDGVLCNMYSVADGLDEQKKMLQSRIDSKQSKPIIEYFAKVIELHSTLPQIVNGQTTATFEHPVNFSSLKAEPVPADVPLKDRIALLKAVPVNIEILNFEHMIRIVDAMADKSHVIIGSSDPLKHGIKSHDSPSLFNNIISTLGSAYPIQFNSPETKTASPPQRHYFTEDSNLKFTIDTESPNSRTLSAKMNISMLNTDVDRPVANALETLKPEERYLYPVIRWGDIDLLFAFPEYFVKLHLSSGDIKVTDDGAKIVFDALRNFNINLKIEARDETNKPPVSASKFVSDNKDIFKCTSIRQVFKRCNDFFKKKASLKMENSAQVINTSSKVSYGPKLHHQYSYLGLADINNFFLLQGVILRKMFSGPPAAPKANDPTVIDFGMLISLRSPNPKVKLNDAKKSLPDLTFPCFFANLCSKEQLTISKLNQVSLVMPKGNEKSPGIPVNLHVRNTFQPITASIAAGLATFLSIFHFETYPKTLEWTLKVAEDQVIGMEMNGIGMFVGKAGPLKIVKYADIPYPSQNGDNVEADMDMLPSGRSQVRNLFEETFANYLSGVDRIIPKSSPQWDSSIPYEKRREFENYFYKDDLTQEFTDEVIIPALAQIPESLPTALRTVMLPMFFDPLNSVTLHPPLFDPENQDNPGKLNHVPMSVALSDSMNFSTGHHKKLNPSLLTKFFAAFIEEFSNAGLDVHSLSDKPSASKVYMSYTRSKNEPEHFSAINPLTFFHKNVDLILWLEFPWALGSIGFDFGTKVTAKILHENDLIADLSISKHHMIGKVAKMRIDFSIETPIMKLLPYIKSLLAPFFAKYNVKFLIDSLPIETTKDLPLKVQLLVDNTFYTETELNIAKEHFEPPKVPSSSSYNNSNVMLTPTSYNVDSVLEKYKSIPNAISCVYNRNVTEEDREKQASLWSILDLSATKVYYAVEKGIKPEDRFQIFFQLFTKNKMSVCGLLNDIKSLAVMFEYIHPSLPLDLLFQGNSSSSPAPAPTQVKKQYYLTEFQHLSSIFFLDNVSFTHPGRYRIYVALAKKNDDERSLKGLNYKLVQFNEVYIENSR